MLPKYLWLKTWMWTNFILKFLLGISTYPFLTWLEVPVYYGSIIITTCGLLLVTFVELFNNNDYRRIQRHTKHEYEIQLFYKSILTPPMPQKYMILSGVLLRDDFSGFLIKLGYRFFGFFRVLYEIGLELSSY